MIFFNIITNETGDDIMDVKQFEKYAAEIRSCRSTISYTSLFCRIS